MQVDPSPLQVSILGTNLLVLAILIEMRVKVGLLWKDYVQRKKLDGN